MARFVPKRWTSAFRSVPRHVFLPTFFRPTGDGFRYTPVSAETDQEEWLRLAYADDAWTTQLDADPDKWQEACASGTVSGTPTSSSTAPGLMARMLEALAVGSGSRVLELGTGTGYNAALLCAGLTDEQITSVEIDNHLVRDARRTLAEAGFHPTVRATDGDVTGEDKYERLIVTYGVSMIPESWLSAVTPGGVIVAPLHREQMIGAVVRLTVENDRHAMGRFLPFYGGFMPTRQRAAPAIRQVLQAAEEDHSSPRSTVLPELSLIGREPWRFFVSLVLGDLTFTDVMSHDFPDSGGLQHWLIAADGSWAYQELTRNGEPIVREGGKRRLWTELETAVVQWADLDKPERERLGLTVQQGRQEIWLDTPDHVVSSFPPATQ